MSRFVAALLSLFFVSLAAVPADAAPTQTRRDRMKGQVIEQKASLDKMYERIHEAFLKDDYAAVDRMAADYLSGAVQRPNAEDVLYLQALSLLKLNRGQQAREKLRQIENSFIGIDRKAQAAASIADSYYFEGDLGMANVAYAETLRRYPQSDQTSYVLSQLAEIASKTDRGQEALGVYYTVQVGSFSRQKNASTLAQKLRTARFDAYVEHDAQGRMYRVRVGKLTSKDEAISLEARLREQGYPTKIFP